MSDAGLATEAEAAYKEAIRYISVRGPGQWGLRYNTLSFRLYPEYDQALNNLANLVKVDTYTCNRRV